MRKPTREEDVRDPARRAPDAAARRLRARSELALLRRLAAARGTRAWIVGGVPRDLLAGRPELDVDVAVSRGAEDLARELSERGFGTCVLLSEAAPRVFRDAGPRVLDLSDLEGASIRDDLARRDFTVNAIAIDLATGEWLDPFGGAADLAARRLRLVAEENLAADPLRAFRAARLFATHELVPDRRTRDACRRAAARLAGVAPERVAAELTKLLESERAGPALAWAADAGLLPYAFDIALPAARLGSAAAFVRRLDRSARGLPPARRVVLRLAAIAAGLRLSPVETARWLSRRRHGRAVAGAAARILELSTEATKGPEGRSAWTWIHDAGPLAADALRLAASRSPSAARSAARLSARLRRARSGPRVTGRDVMRWADAPPGPRVGQLLRDVRIEGLRGGIRTRSDARDLVRAASAAPKIVRRIARRL